jgi:hypothetical protein
MSSKRADEILMDGEYEVMCRERTILGPAVNGHSAVFSRAKMVVKDGWATFTRDGAGACQNFSVPRS